MSVIVKWSIVIACFAVTALCASIAYEQWQAREATRIKQEAVRAWDAANRARLEELKKKWAPAKP